MHTPEADADVTGTYRIPRPKRYELASLDEAFGTMRASMLEELAAMKRACEVESDFDEKLVARLEARLEQVSDLFRRCQDIHQRRQKLLQGTGSAFGGV